MQCARSLQGIYVAEGNDAVPLMPESFVVYLEQRGGTGFTNPRGPPMLYNPHGVAVTIQRLFPRRSVDMKQFVAEVRRDIEAAEHDEEDTYAAQVWRCISDNDRSRFLDMMDPDAIVSDDEEDAMSEDDDAIEEEVLEEEEEEESSDGGLVRVKPTFINLVSDDEDEEEEDENNDVKWARAAANMSSPAERQDWVAAAPPVSLIALKSYTIAEDTSAAGVFYAEVSALAVSGAKMTSARSPGNTNYPAEKVLRALIVFARHRPQTRGAFAALVGYYGIDERDWAYGISKMKARNVHAAALVDTLSSYFYSG